MNQVYISALCDHDCRPVARPSNTELLAEIRKLKRRRFSWFGAGFVVACILALVVYRHATFLP